MNSIILTCCGEQSALPVEGGLTCPACGTQFTEIQFEELQELERTKIPVADLPRIQGMLQMTAEEILKSRSALELTEEPGLGLVAPIAVIRRFANEKGLQITPRPVLWAKKQQSS